MVFCVFTFNDGVSNRERGHGQAGMLDLAQSGVSRRVQMALCRRLLDVGHANACCGARGLAGAETGVCLVWIQAVWAGWAM